MKYSPRQYKEILLKLPEDIQKIVVSFDNSEKLWAIGEKHKLHIDNIGKMHDIALDVMMGIVPTGKFIEELAKETGIPRLEASTIVHDIDEEIFKPIKELMIKTYAGEAPYRPKSSLQTMHEDEDHDTLHRDELLRSIEEPEISQVKKWRSDGTIESIVTFSDTKEFSKTPDPEVFKKTEPGAPLNLSQTLKESRERLLNLISSKKLDSVVTMTPHEKKEDGLPTPPTFIPEAKKEPVIQVVERPVEVKKIPENPFIVTPSKVENVPKPTIPTPPAPEFIVPKVEVTLEVASKSLPEIAPEILPATTTPVAQKPATAPVRPPVVSSVTQAPVAKTVFNVVDPYREL